MQHTSTQLITDFKNLPYDTKFQKIKTMLQALQEVGGIIGELKKLIEINDHPEDAILEMIYTTIIQTADQIQQQIHDQKIEEFAHIRQALANIKSQEQANQGDPDDVLNQL